MNEQIIVGGIGLSVVILVLIQAIKMLNFNTKFIPLIAIILGIAGAMVYKYTAVNTLSLFEAIVYGIMSGATSSGLYSYAKSYVPSIVSATEKN